MFSKENILPLTDSSKSCLIKVCILVLFLFTLGKDSSAQVYKEFETGFSTIFNHGFSLNSYYFGDNPAYLDFNVTDELLSIKNITKNSEGEFKKFIAPETDRSFGFFATGKKSIDSTQKFKGSFGFSKLERKNWNWFFTRDYDTDNPFLIGDSTTGNSRINGILINAQYAINISDKLSAGVNLDYAVDEGLKTVSPRPTSEHRDIGIILGIGYSFDNKLSVGLTASFSDKNEQISYREDEGALTQETIILKFKGYDFPNIIRKKVETRYSYTNNYSAGITFSYNDEEKIILAGYIKTGFEKKSILEDALDPKGEGFWKDDFLDAGLKIKMDITEGINSGLTYNYSLKQGWAKYPPTEVLYYERNNDTHSLIIGVEQKVNTALSMGIETGYLFNSKNDNDHYSMVKSKTNFNIWSGKIGVNYKWSDMISMLVAYGFSKKSNSFNELSKANNSDYFTNYRINDLLFLQTGFSKQSFSITSEIMTTELGSYLFQLNYALLKPELDSIFSKNRRSELELTLEYRVKVF